ncbi:HD domain-containing protein [Acidaminobacter sp. JC074]|uniref:HD domain-containing protein n=1 Tax=Acidaminobacter sp. JC074 TaxID=2530199 RepID=UPI001F1047CC|nr:HD domain-containing protein [Acidaminobacter sp. JC074]MCH4887781.1 HD domain-containing protein [Acidaminobacter sp. JC074]
MDQLFKDIHDEVVMNTRIDMSKEHIQHGNTSVYDHTLSVAKMSYKIALILGLNVNLRSLIIGALLHDYFLYDWHENDGKLHGITHPKTAYENAKVDFELDDVSKDVILKHMFPLTVVPPLYTESWIVTFSDKVCAIGEIIYLNELKKKVSVLL